jgi:hypothetical protein
VAADQRIGTGASAYERIMGQIEVLEDTIRRAKRRQRIVSLFAGFGAASLVVDIARWWFT